MKILRYLQLAFLLAGLLTTPGAFAASTGELLQQGLYAEEVEGNMETAIKFYSEAIKNNSASPNQIAQALYRQGMCYLKLKDEPAARAALEKLVADHPNQTELIAKAKPVLDELTDFDPASLMPAGTLVYVEFGNPGQQIETILSLLKGTPFENPLAAMGGKPGDSNQKSPGDIAGALLNPSMTAEFKKIRSSAIGITGIAQQNPPMVSVLFPGKSDALRGLLLAAIGMAGNPGDAIEGMQTVTIRLNEQQSLAIAYDDRVFITAMPSSQLAWCVKQYKGLISEPTLISANKSFAKLSKAQRQKNALTLWANVDEVHKGVLKIFPPNEIPKQFAAANVIMDFENIDDLILTQSLETNGLAAKLEIQFKDGHHCLPYDLIRTPNISKTALEAVPSQAVALTTFALTPADSAQAERVRAKIQNITGLDLGREVFANIEQVTIFAMPAGEIGNDFLPASFGLAITSHNPEKTRQLLTTLLGTVSTLSFGVTDTKPGQYRVGTRNGPPLYCYLEQVNSTTILSLDHNVVTASLNALKQHQSICSSGPLNSAVSKLSPNSSKVVLVNLGGAIRLAEPQMHFGHLDDAKLKEVKKNLSQIALATDATTIQLRTDEQSDNFAAYSAVVGLPTLDKVIAPITQIQSLTAQARAQAETKELQQQKAATIRQATQAPQIDGQPDDVWNSAQSSKLEQVLTSSESPSNALAADFKTMWDEKNFYLLVNVTDSTPHRDADIEWQYNDGIEFYLDCKNAKAPDFGENDYQYTFNWDPTSPEMRERKHNRTDGVKYALVTTEKGYRLEAAFPWTTLGVKPGAGNKIGFDVQVNDNQGDKKRDGKISWHDANDRAWQSPQAFGVGELAGLIGWWKFDETDGNTAHDSSGGNHNGTLVGKAKWAKGKLGGAIDLNGEGSFVRIADKSAFDLGGQITIAAWVNMRSVPKEWTAIITKGDTAWRLSTVQQEPKIHFMLNQWPEAFNGSTDLSANEWHHVAAVYDGNEMQIYLDGKLDASRAFSDGISRNDAEVLIGENAEMPNRCFDGLIDDVRIYNYGLSESEIKTLAARQVARQ